MGTSTYNITICWKELVKGTVEVVASSVEEAKKLALKNIDENINYLYEQGEVMLVETESDSADIFYIENFVKSEM